MRIAADAVMLTLFGTTNERASAGQGLCFGRRGRPVDCRDSPVRRPHATKLGVAQTSLLMSVTELSVSLNTLTCPVHERGLEHAMNVTAEHAAWRAFWQPPHGHGIASDASCDMGQFFDLAHSPTLSLPRACSC